jgi:hypothetical protein
VRIVLRDNDGANRGPGTVTAIIENASTVGVSVRYNEPGEFYFTLVATHPQVGACEPWQTHYAVQQYRNGAWKDLSNGLLTDFEAGSDDVTVFGLDYLGILSRSIDPRIPPDGENPTRPSEGKYHDVTIGSIIEDQLTQARTAPKSPIAFIFNGSIDGLNTKVSIFSSFKYRLDFIRGLIESHKAGTGKRSRLRCRKDPSQADKWVWDLREVSGVDRDNLRLEYGSLLQNYRVIALGEDFATRAHGVGTEPNNVRPKYAAYPSNDQMATDPIVNIFGNIQRAVGPFVDLSDANDIKRRVKQARLEAAKVGKRISLHLRVHGVAPLDGYDLTDSIPIDIDRGVVDTDAYGSGYWTIWGLEWRLFPDGHDELTWVVSPRLDETPPDEDLIASDPIHNTPEWEIGVGPPPPEPALMAMRYYFDIENGVIYEREPPDYYGWTEVGSLPPPVGYPGNDAQPPDVTGFSAVSIYLQQADGTDLPVISATWVTLLEDDIIGYELEWQAGTYDTTTPELPVYEPPDFLSPQSLRVAKDQDFAVLQPVLGGRSYDVRIRGYDMEGLVGDWVYASEVVIVPDADAPAIPSVDAVGGYKMLGANWGRNSEQDLSHYGVRFRPVGDLDWRFIDTRSNHITISDLAPGDWEVQVRALDHSLNVQTSATDPTALGPEDTGYEEAGWSDVSTATVTLVGQADVVFDTVVADFMATGTLSADQIIGGSLKVGGTGFTEGLRIYDSLGRPIGAWGEWGWIVADPTSPGRAIWASPQGELKFTSTYDWDGTDPIEQGIDTTVWTTAIGPDGINVGAIKFGSALGGSNRILNAGVELQAFPTVAVSSKTWTVTADWDDATSTVNLDVSGADLKMTAI